jgi:hypothetical protein
MAIAHTQDLMKDPRASFTVAYREFKVRPCLVCTSCIISISISISISSLYAFAICISVHLIARMPISQ